MKVKVYAVLKDYFPSLSTLDADLSDVSALKAALSELNPNAESVLNRSRFAVGNSFVGPDYVLKGTDLISVIPPSSGG